jgi:uncharacterized lipoprotein
MLKILSVILVTGLLMGCQTIKGNDKQYLKSSLINPLKMPAGLTLKEDKETYPLPPQVPQPGTVAPVSIEPPGFGRLD